MIYLLYLLILITIYTISFFKSKQYLDLRIKKIMIRVYSIIIVVFSILLAALAFNNHYEVNFISLLGILTLFIAFIPCNVFYLVVKMIKNSEDKNFDIEK